MRYPAVNVGDLTMGVPSSARGVVPCFPGASEVTSQAAQALCTFRAKGWRKQACQHKKERKKEEKPVRTQNDSQTDLLPWKNTPIDFTKFPIKHVEILEVGENCKEITKGN